MPTEKEKMVAGETYDPTDPELVADRQRARERTRELAALPADAQERRFDLAADLFGDCAEPPYLEPPVHCDYGYNVHVGERFYANTDCVFLDVCPIEFGDHCLLGPGVHVYTATHPLDADERREGLESGKPVTVGDDVWIGGRAVLNPGVTVGDRTVIGSGSVVTRDVPSDVVVRGNPAEVVKRLE